MVWQTTDSWDPWIHCLWIWGRSQGQLICNFSRAQMYLYLQSTKKDMLWVQLIQFFITGLLLLHYIIRTSYHDFVPVFYLYFTSWKFETKWERPRTKIHQGCSLIFWQTIRFGASLCIYSSYPTKCGWKKQVLWPVFQQSQWKILPKIWHDSTWNTLGFGPNQSDGPWFTKIWISTGTGSRTVLY